MMIRTTLMVLLARDCFEGKFVEYIKITESPAIFHQSGRIYVNSLASHSNPSAKIGCSSPIRSLVSLVPKPRVNLLAWKPLYFTPELYQLIFFGRSLSAPRKSIILFSLERHTRYVLFARFLSWLEPFQRMQLFIDQQLRVASPRSVRQAGSWPSPSVCVWRPLCWLPNWPTCKNRGSCHHPCGPAPWP